MNTNENKIKPTLSELRKRIAKLSGRIPQSTDERYLAQKLEQLEEKRRNGEDTRSRWGSEPHEPVTISLTRPARDALRKLAEDNTSGNVSNLVSLALREYAAKHGASATVRRAFGDES